MLKDKVKLDVWDVDGVLIDSMEQMWLAVCETFRTFGVTPPTLEHFCRTLFAPFDGWYRLNGLAQIPAERVQEVFRSAWSAHRPSVFPGIPKLLRTLRKHDRHQVIISASSRSRISESFAAAGLDEQIFAAIHCGVQEKTTDLQRLCTQFGVRPDQAVYVGDLRSDVRDGKAAGVRTVAFIGKHGCRSSFKNDPPDHFVDDHEALAQLLLS